MTNKYKVWRRGSYYLQSFPKRNCTLLYNSDTKKYDFVKGVATSPKPDNVKRPVTTTMKWYYYTCILSGLIGILSAVLIYQWIITK